MTHKKRNFLGLFAGLFIATALVCGPEVFANDAEQAKQSQEKHVEISYTAESSYLAQCCSTKKTEEKACDKKKKDRKKDKDNQS